MFPAPHPTGREIWLLPSPSNKDSVFPSRASFHSRLPSVVSRLPSMVQLNPLKLFVDGEMGSEACLPEPLKMSKLSLVLVSIAASLLPSEEAVSEWYKLASRVIGWNCFPLSNTTPICQLSITKIPLPS